MGGQAGGAEAPTLARARTGTAIGVMGLIAVLVCGGLVTAMRANALGSDNDRSISGAETEVPTTLAGDMVPGEVPPEVAAVAEGPVVGALRVTDADDLPPAAEVDNCLGQGTFADAPTLESALVTPRELTISWVGPADESFFGGGAFASDGEIVGDPDTEPAATVPPSPTDEPVDMTKPPVAAEQQVRAVCTLQWSGDDWSGGGGFSGPADVPGGGMGSMGSTCCDAEGFSSSAGEVSVPEGAQWALQPRGAYTLAYPVDDLTTLVISWRFREGPFGMTNRGTSVLWVDADGEVIAEEHVQF